MSQTRQKIVNMYIEKQGCFGNPKRRRKKNIFFLAARGRAKENLFVPVATQENLEPTYLHPKSLFPSFISETHPPPPSMN